MSLTVQKIISQSSCELYKYSKLQRTYKIYGKKQKKTQTFKQIWNTTFQYLVQKNYDNYIQSKYEKNIILNSTFNRMIIGLSQLKSLIMSHFYEKVVVITKRTTTVITCLPLLITILFVLKMRKHRLTSNRLSLQCNQKEKTWFKKYYIH